MAISSVGMNLELLDFSFTANGIKVIQQFGNIVWQIFIKLNVQLPYYPAISLLGIYHFTLHLKIIRTAFKRTVELLSPVQENIYLFWVLFGRRSLSWEFQILREEKRMDILGDDTPIKILKKENCKKTLKLHNPLRDPLYKLGLSRKE